MKTALPSESELAAEFDVSRVTIRQALDRLHFKGLIYREKGRGSYVRSLHVGGVTGLGSFSNEVEAGGASPTSRLIALTLTSALPDDMLRHVIRPPSPDETFHKLSRVRLIDGAPVAREDAYLPVRYFPEIAASDVENGSLYGFMRDRWGLEPAWADAALEPCSADAELADQLDVEFGTPLLVAWRVTSTEQDEIVEYVRSVYRGDGFALTINRHKID